MIRKIKSFSQNRFTPVGFLISLVVLIYYKFFFLGKIPIPTDLLIGSYSPWFDYFKMPVQNPLISDAYSQFMVWKYLAIDSIKQGQWPLWNPYSFTGNPLLATYHSSSLYPLNMLLFLPKHFGWGIYIFSQSLFAALSFYLFTSTFTKSKLARLTGSVLFAFGGLMTTWLELGTAGHAMAWVPLSLYFVKKFSDTFRFRFLIFFIFSQSLTILSGHAQITTYSFLILFVFLVILNLKNYSKILILSLALFLPILLTSFQLIPSYELLGKSIRQTEGYSAEFNFGLLDKRDFLKFFIPDYFGNPTTRNYWGYINYSETSAFLGSLVLPFLIYGLFKLRGKIFLFFLALLGLSLLLGFNNLISSYIYHLKIPLLTSSYASRILFISLLSTCVITVLSIEDIIKNNRLNFFLKTLLWSWAAILGIILGTFLSKYLIQDILKKATIKTDLEFFLSNSDYSLQNFSIAIKNSLLPFALLTFTLISSFSISKIKIKFNKLNLIFSLVLIVTFFEMGRYFLKFNPFISQKFIFPQVPALDFLQKQTGYFRVGKEHAETFPSNTWIAYNLYSYEGYDPIYLDEYGKFMHFLNSGEIKDASSTRYAELAATYTSPFLDALNMKYFISILRDANGYTPGDLLNYKVQEAGYNLVFKDKSAAILENPNSLDRVYFAKNIKTLTKQQIQELFTNDKTFDPTTTVALSQDLKINKVSGEGEAKILSYSPNIVSVQTNTKNEEILVLADQYENGWKASLDNGQNLEISPANLILRAVKVPAGTHTITFKYEPESFFLGLKIAAITFVGILIFSIIAQRKKIF